MGSANGARGQIAPVRKFASAAEFPKASNFQGVALMRRFAAPFVLLASVAAPALAQVVPPQNSRPAATAKTDTIPAARDVAYPGTIQLTVDASDVTLAIFRIHEHVPVARADRKSTRLNSSH